MKKGKKILLITLALTLLLASCSGPKFSFSISTLGNKTTVKIDNAKDGAYAESDPISVGKGENAVVESGLDKGKLQIEFVDVAVFQEEDKPDDIVKGDVMFTLTVVPGETWDTEIQPGDYVLQFTTIGETNGKVEVRFEKK